MYNRPIDEKERQLKQEIKALARAAFDYEDWNIFFTNGGVSIQPTGNQIPSLNYKLIQDCVDDLRFRGLTRFTSLQGDF